MKRFKLLFASLLFVLFFISAFIRQSQQEELKPKFNHPQIIRYNHDAFFINGKQTFLFSGSVHYFRCEPAEWISILEKIKDAGFNTITTYVPWNYHERVEGNANFSSLNKFLNDCQQMGFYVIIRVGPYVCGEWDEGGFPHWLAGKGIGFRTPSLQDIYWSSYWYNEVLPVVRKHLITNGGNIILLQIENEYDHFGLPDSQKVKYLKSLYRDVMQNGIDVPVITCWTKQVRDNTDSVFSQIMDAVNGYPGWNIEALLPRIEELKKQEPDSPPIFTELQGGWFTGIRDKTVRLPDKYGAGQINALTKYVIAHGIKGFNYYMLYGGTNFGYRAGKGKTTSYDYTAPISECGGLWEKYYAVKLIGDLIRYAGHSLSRCREIPGGAVSNEPGIETLLRSDGKTGFIFVMNKTNEKREAKIEIKMPEQAQFDLPVAMQPRGAVFLPVDFPIPGGSILNYSNVELFAIANYNGKPLLAAYGTPGEEAFINYGSRVFKKNISTGDELYSWNGAYILLTSRERASKALVLKTKTGPSILLSDSYLSTDASGNSIRLQTRPGRDEFSLIMTGGVKLMHFNGRPINYKTTQDDQVIHFTLNTPELQIPKITFGQIKHRMDKAAEKDLYFKPVPLSTEEIIPTLDSLGNHLNGYSIYVGKFRLQGENILKFGYYDDDWHSVLIDGKSIKGLTGSGFQDWANVNLTGGVHNIKIIYENEGRQNTGFMEQKKGLKFIHVISPGQKQTLVNWKYFIQKNIQPGKDPAEADTGYDDSKWLGVSLENGMPEKANKEQLGSWYRRKIILSKEEAQNNPRLFFGGISTSAKVYVNGKSTFDFRHHGWDAPFIVPLNGITKAGTNIISIYIENREGKGGISKPVDFEYGNEEPLKLIELSYHALLNGELAGWQKPAYSDVDWKTVNGFKIPDPAYGIEWYRTTFVVPRYKGWVVPWKINIQSTGNVQIWLNGKLLGRYYAHGPQKNFYMPDGWLKPGKKNSLALVMRSSDNGNIAPVLKEVSVSPYSEYVVQKNVLKFIH